MAINEHFDLYPDALIENVKKNIESRGLKLVPNFRLYIYLDGRYGNNTFSANGFPASITGHGAHRFGNVASYEANKIYVDEEKKYVIFLSPTHGGVNIFSDWVPYRHRW